MTHIFICWSGERSQRLGDALRTYLPKFIPGLSEDSEETSLFISSPKALYG